MKLRDDVNDAGCWRVCRVRNAVHPHRDKLHGTRDLLTKFVISRTFLTFS